MNSYTKGPWYVSGEWTRKTEVSNGDGTICICDDGDDNFDHVANARLIAAAPDLVDGINALLGLIQLVSARADMPPQIQEALRVSHRVEEARAALAKATGDL